MYVRLENRVTSVKPGPQKEKKAYRSSLTHDGVELRSNKLKLKYPKPKMLLIYLTYQTS